MCVRPRRVRVGGSMLLAAMLSCALLGGCGAASAPTSGESSASAPPHRTASAGPTPSIPRDGLTLRELAFTNGPLDVFSIPASAMVTDRVDQPNAVTLVISAPDTAALADYYRTALPAAAFTITAEDPVTGSMTFTGHGWSGALTGSDDATAVSLRPTG